MPKFDRHMRVTYPYGKWTTKGGDQVLFNRDYNPIWKKSADGTVTQITEYWFVPDIVSSEYYYNDSNPPHRDGRWKETKASRARCVKVLQEFGV